MWKMLQATFVSLSRFVVEKKKRLLAIAKIFTFHANAKKSSILVSRTKIFINNKTGSRNY